jgi:ERCC4-type nuclease
LTILADHRERASGIPEALVGLGFAVELSSIPVADYLVAEGVGVERKTGGDLHRSIVNRRLWRQVASLRTDLERAYLVVEGDDLDAGRVSRVGVRGALLAASDLGVAVIRSRSNEDTALWLARVATRHQLRKPRRVARSLPYGHAPTPVNVLASLHGISPVAARNLLEQFGSIAGVAAAERCELLTVPGIGARRAETLIRLLGHA